MIIYTSFFGEVKVPLVPSPSSRPLGPPLLAHLLHVPLAEGKGHLQSLPTVGQPLVPNGASFQAQLG